MRRIGAIVLPAAGEDPEALERIAETALGYTPRLGIAIGDSATPQDAVYLDLTGCAHLHGGEEACARELGECCGQLVGSPVRVAIADGPRIARAVALHASARETIVPQGCGKEALARLPIEALPLDREIATWLARLGISTVSELARLPAASLSARLGPRARDVFELIDGRDAVPITPYEPPRIPTEQIAWEEGVSSLESVLFALRGLVAKLSSRLEARGQATRSIELRLFYDASIAHLRGVGEVELPVSIELPTALAREPDLFRVLKAKLETQLLEAPVKALLLAATGITRAPRIQLDLGRETSVSPEALPTLLAELSAELPPSDFGVFRLLPSHRPEARAELIPPVLRAKPAPLSASEDDHLPTRLLPHPVPIAGALSVGESFAVEDCIFTVEAIRRHIRLDHVEWWSESPLARDYACVWLKASQTYVQAWVFRDRHTGERFLHGYFD